MRCTGDVIVAMPGRDVIPMACAELQRIGGQNGWEDILQTVRGGASALLIRKLKCEPSPPSFLNNTR